ncbi:hypothetical protein LTR87_014000 [Friedmanniomyces endolithicus]|uniref:AAA+ ATPase domain-containing protein n=1 Tax=Friedmanniomyces endolithicus TaxID=329885 RepID=A0A4U0URD4_9PEZI|nr:hypothetical protein LTR75_016231 [Friedmanniomyces endolithicus]KAK0868830.1 hypothetical protein LTR87_014000 [Friedmanniomyces endolithicus]TKA37495.1 hypothetical protein B0A54_11453 [Friedmanniomyces endolithicus]
MAAVAALVAMHGESRGSVHPFFKHNTGCHDEARHHTTNDETEQLEVEQTDEAQDDKPKARRTRKPRALAEDDTKGKKQKTLLDILNSNIPTPPASGTTVEHAINLVSSDPIVEVSMRKRKRPSQMWPQDVPVDDPVIPNSMSDPAILSREPADPATLQRPREPYVLIPASSPLPQQSHINDGESVNADMDPASTPPPRKLLRLNANGRFSSPASKGDRLDGDTLPEAPRRRGRPRKTKEVARLVVTLLYSNSASRPDTGDMIGRILSGEERVAPPPDQPATPKKPRAPRKPRKPTHPFFTGKPTDQPPPSKLESPRKTTASTPGKLKMKVMSDRIPNLKERPYAVGSSLLKDRLMVKHPGALEPPWPERDQAHVRGPEQLELLLASADSGVLPHKRRKRKAAETSFPAEESVLRLFSANLRPEESRRLRPDGFLEQPTGLHVPMRLVISGHEIRQRIASDLSADLRDDADDLLISDLPSSSQLDVHPALQRLWGSIPHTLSAFDELRGEFVGWAQKYAPEVAAEVLQPAHEMRVLKDWLTSLVVSAVEGTGIILTKAPSKLDIKPRKKRRRKHEDMDDFLVDSDEEESRILDELADSEGAAPMAGTKPFRSVVHTSMAGTKLSNTVLLSGPSGCGKTAAAYAVAKELGFKVFEISSSERRSGKDVLDKIGDMTENHLVKHHGLVADDGMSSSAEESHKARLEEAFEQDLASGRQGKMGAFFKPKIGLKEVPLKSKAKVKEKGKVMKEVEQAIKKPSKDQQQSLVLLEEVDVLFKDDKEFWSTVLKLIVSSKRPFILTCNDEDLVPLQAMSLHAILRFSPPPIDLAIDHLLLVAAAEGHLLKRDAVASLYHAKGRDLRASINELDFWCQMAVGDVKEGLGWFYQRWPPGSDVDGRGRRLRVVSEGTYREGMGMISGSLGTEEESMMWGWQQYGVQPMYWLDAAPTLPVEDQGRLAALRQCAVQADALSALDVFARPGLPQTVALNTTAPEMLDRTRGQYIEGLRLVQADEQVDHTGLCMQLVVASVRALSHNSMTINSPTPPSLMDRLGIAVAANPGCADEKRTLTRLDFAVFDPVSSAPESSLSTHPSGLQLSAFDGPLSVIATDLAPYVRGIVQYDLAFEEERERIEALLDEGEEGPKARRKRTTRAARSAVEGGERGKVRRERWFGAGLGVEGVLWTGGRTWPRVTLRGVELDGKGSPNEE